MNQQWLPVYISLLTPIATLMIVMVGFLYSNRRLDDLGSHVDHRINDLRDLLRAEMAKNHSEMLTKFAEQDTRLTGIESRFDHH